MNVRCPECKSVFRVDPEKVPIQGVRARCAHCRAIFSLSRSGVVTALPAERAASGAQAHAVETANPSATRPGIIATGTGLGQDTGTGTAPEATPKAGEPTSPSTPVSARASTPGAAVATTATPAPATAAKPGITPVQAEPRPAGPPAPGSSQAANRPGGAAKRPSFAKLDPNVRAQRLARALVSDIVAYHKDKREAALQAGTLRNEFREEIRKSWEEYVAQVGLDLARSTPFFRDSLNEILAKGQSLF